MQILRDAQGGEWPLEMRLPALRRVRAGCDVNFLGSDDKELQAAFQDWMLLSEVIYYLLQPEVEKRNMSREDFDNRWDLESLMVAMPQVMEDFANFVPPFMRSQIISAATETKAQFAKMMAQEDGKILPSESEDSSASTPMSIPSDNSG